MKRITVSISDYLHNELMEMAKLSGGTLSEQVRVILVEHAQRAAEARQDARQEAERIALQKKKTAIREAERTPPVEKSHPKPRQSDDELAEIERRAYAGLEGK